MRDSNTNIFSYDFDWFETSVNKEKDMKNECCKKYKKKGEKKCKKCPKRKL